jgi:hypothetical protein
MKPLIMRSNPTTTKTGSQSYPGRQVMKEIKISHGGQEGRILYDPEDVAGFEIEHPDPEVVKAVRRHFTTKREFRIPESQEIDDFRVDLEIPIKDENYFMMALCEMAATTGVDWEIPKEESS